MKNGKMRLVLSATPAALKEVILKSIKEGWGQRPGWNELEKRLFFPDYAPGLDYFNTGGWLENKDKFNGIKLFIYETGKGMTSVPLS